MTDADIVHDADSPATRPEDWEGAALEIGGRPIGRARTRGPNKRPTKQQTAIRFDADVLAGLRATGKGWQTRVNETMREWLKTRAA
ncbi:MAG: BrnA antitoxin family protein [Candidatus Accumulibacter sp.]|nr:BrnA antitoxin family protein [Accumulibacter sp.]